MCVHSTFSCQAQGSRYGNDRVTTDEICAGLCNSSASELGPPKEYTSRRTHQSGWRKGSLEIAYYLEKSLPEGSKKFTVRMPGRGRREGDWDTVIRSSWNWKESKTSSWLTSPRIIRNSFQLCGKSLSALSAQMPPWRSSMKWVSGKCQHGSKIRLPMAWLGEDRPERWRWWSNLWYQKHTPPQR